MPLTPADPVERLLTGPPVAVHVDDTLSRVEFADARRGLVTGWNGIMLSTADGGKTWRDLFELVFVSARKPLFFEGRHPCFRIADEAGLLAPLEAGTDMAIVSEAGCPGIADPGGTIVAAAHARGLRAARRRPQGGHQRQARREPAQGRGREERGRQGRRSTGRRAAWQGRRSRCS